MLPVQAGLPEPTTYAVNNLVVNEGCNYGNVQSISVEHIVQIAETRHQQTVVNLAESANHEHVRLMTGLSQEAALALQRQASEALARSDQMERNQKALQHLSEMAHNAKISQL